MARKVKSGLTMAERQRALAEALAAAERAQAEAAARAAEEARQAELAAKKAAQAAKEEADRKEAERRKAERMAAKRPRFVYTPAKVEKREPVKATPLYRSSSFTGKLMSKNLALPPKEDEARRPLA
jgi:multidrug efflux pump subunit AcrA (membrane-fusion protein)